MTFLQSMLTIAICALATMAMRFLPFLIFSEKKQTPAYIQYLGDTVTDGRVPEDDLVLTMTANGKSDTVNVHYSVDENYDLTVTLSQNGDSRLHVFMKASVTEKTRDDVTTTTVTWNEPIIRKGGGAV